MMLYLTIIRHGMTRMNKEKKYVGATDDILCDDGIKTILEYKNASLFPENPDCIFVSPMTRCRQTAELLFEGQSYEIVDDLREMNFGIFEGKNYLELDGNADYQRWVDSNCESDIPEGESKKDFEVRTLRAFDDILGKVKKEDFLSKDLEVVVVAHGGTAMVIGSNYLDGEYYDYLIDNAKSIRLVYDDKRDKWERK